MTSQTDRISAALAGRYRIERHLGEGGMATVYLAEDLKHDRKVALKLLKPELAAVLGAERFVKEIKTTAALQHPHILPLFDSGTVDGFLFYVMPFIDGETLREKLNRETQLSVQEAVRIAREVADALDYAHRHGVIHRDIKPENILLHDGRPMVADFGIALAVSAAAGGRMTETGLSLGTPHYMSPEQATAEKDISARSDVYSLATVLFEMLAGQPPHLGGSAQQIIMKIITEPAPNVTVLRKSVPPNVAHAVAKALEKLPADRFESAKAFADALGNPAYTNPSGAPVAGFATAGRTGVPLRIFVATCLVAIAATAAATWWIAASIGDELAVVRFAFSTESNAPTLTHVALSPDGRTVVYSMRDGAGSSRLFSRPVNDLRQQAIAGTEGGRFPFFSPDGRSIGFNDGQQLKKIPVDGGTAITLAPLDIHRGASWGPDGIVVSSGGRLVLVPSDGGTPVPLVRGDSTRGFWPVVLPGGKAVVYSTAAGVDAPLAVMVLATGRSTKLDLAGVPVGIAAGELVFAQSDGALMAAPFDVGARVVTGGARVVVAELRRDIPTGATAAALSGDGTLAYLTGSEDVQAVVVDLQGAARPLPIPPGRIDNLRYAPDGRRVAANVGGDVYIYDVGSGAAQRVTADGAGNLRPAWNPDGTRILYSTIRGGQNPTIWWQPADGSGAAEQLMASPGKDIWEGEITPDSMNVVYRTGLVPSDIVYRRLAGDTAEKVIAASRFNEYAPRLSPDGRWVAYGSDESGSTQVYVRPFPGPGAQVPISVTGGTSPVWSRDSRKIFFVNERQLVAASVVTTGFFSVTARETLFEGNYRTGFRHASYDVAPDGKSFLMLRPVEGRSEQIVVIHNWAAELQARANGASQR